MLTLSQEQNLQITLDIQMKHPKATAKAAAARTKTVSFKRTVQVQECLHLAAYTEEERTACWYTKEQYKEMKTEAKFTVHLMESKILLEDDDTYSRRGLEHRTNKGSRRRSQNREFAFCAVMDEQDHQWHHDLNDPGYIAQLYATETRHCQLQASKIGHADAKAAHS